eukprot:CAMPEP_0201727926 /NCGR_PEP_ID=MMETSP0593-20130828/14124_1 /ASSEMBLY_ACC=CAM_ASM_000672 /TAXON_ID=267983 /ORGANISM="Skeletonema japonicum, Strain CCMP2506" /LENGTH=77 /DNA_ID=CAMNT_0048219871 /DNA_START=71 /DNA_END=300 /DNA_ORIENTATION=-
MAVLNDDESVGLSVVGNAVASTGMAVGDANEGGAVGLDVVGDIVASTGIAVRNNVTDGEPEGLEVGSLVVGDNVVST